MNLEYNPEILYTKFRFRNSSEKNIEKIMFEIARTIFQGEVPSVNIWMEVAIHAMNISV